VSGGARQATLILRIQWRARAVALLLEMLSPIFEQRYSRWWSSGVWFSRRVNRRRTPTCAEADLTAIKRYAAELGLERFLLIGSIAAAIEYETLQSGHECGYRATGRRMLRTDSAGRFRIKPERLKSLFAAISCGGATFSPICQPAEVLSRYRSSSARNLAQRFGLDRTPVADPCRTYSSLCA
jgi:hypothetical protein